MTVDSAITSLLDLDPASTSISSSGAVGMSSASTAKITTKLPDSTIKTYFLKTGTGAKASTMFKGEHTSLNQISSIVPSLCPRSYGHGSFASDPNRYFLVTDYLDLSTRGSKASGQTLAQKLAKLHTTPAPIPPGHTSPQYGFFTTTCCGDTPQDNTFSSSWRDFYCTHRLMFILAQCENAHGGDHVLRTLVENTCAHVATHLLCASRLQGLQPVVVHGDLWSGNAGVGKLPGMTTPEAVVFDSSACYAHSEFELGIMKMFGGFGRDFAEEYHRLVPKCGPVEEYEDRVALYELYHHLNHYALFGGGYKSGAMEIMRRLVGRYGKG